MFLLWQTLEYIKRKQVEKYHKAAPEKKEEIECNPYVIFHQALENCKPVVGLASIQRGGKYYQVSVKAEKSSFGLFMPTKHEESNLITY